MCYLCRKLEEIGSIDQKAKEPIFTLLFKLHRQQIDPKPRENRSKWRLELTIKLRALLEALNKGLHARQLAAIIDLVDKEINHIKMSNHMPPHGSTNQKETKRGAETWPPSPLYSEEIRRVKEREIRDAKSKFASETSPSESERGRSVLLVNKWISRCDRMVLSEQQSDDHDSLVSLSNGTIRERPKIEDGMLWRVGDEEANRKQAKEQTSQNDNECNNNYRERKFSSNDCVYDAPERKYGINEVRRMVEYNGGRLRGDRKPSSSCRTRRVSRSMNSNSFQDPIDRASQSHTARGALPRHSRRKRAIHNDELGSSTPMFNLKNLTNTASKGYEKESRGDRGCSMSLASSRSSITNIGSIILQAPPHKGTTMEIGSESTWRNASIAQVPAAIGRPASPTVVAVSTKGSVTPRPRKETQYDSIDQVLHDSARHKVDVLCKPPHARVTSDRVKVANARMSGEAEEELEIVSEAIKASRRRRGERAANSVPFTNRYMQEKRQEMWKQQAAGL